MTPPQRFRLMVSFAPKEGVSMEDFRAHWSGTHARLFLSLMIVRTNILKYEQFYVDAGSSATMAQIAAVLGRENNSTLPAGGGVAVLEAETPEKILAIFKDEEFLRVVAPDQESFIDGSSMRVLSGHYTTMFEA
ncbi:hypothetical protein GY45DRAFT_1324032 [Cubamyces sp. BRFM 1775]|nr:hypothetical protein GY45DRAFT_1324032 [Cubamyces sp. BRFM 1775]